MPNDSQNPGRWSLRLWQTAFNAVGDPISIQDTDFNILMVNQAFADALGKKPYELVGQKCYTLLHGCDRQPDGCPGRATLKKGKNSSEYIHSETLGRDLRVMTSPVADDAGKVTGIVHICHDISGIKRAQAALAESEKRYKAIVENMRSGVVLFKGLAPTFVNQQASRITGYSNQELLGMTLADLVEPADRHLFDELVPRLNLSAESGIKIECWMRRKDGNRIFVLNRFSIFSSDPLAPSYLVILTDLTEMKETQHKIESLYREESELRQKLQKEISRRAQYTHTLVHEIKTPLTPVLASSELLAEKLTEEPWAGLAQNIYRGASILDRRIEDLLDLANIEVGNMKLVTRKIDLRKTISGAVAMVKPRLEANRQELSVSLPERQVQVRADEDRLYQVLMNLLTNAAKYSEAGTKIDITLAIKKQEAVVSVSDHGRGMSPEVAKNVFEPYFREDHAHPDGLGLGLPLSRNLVELQGGRMWLESRQGKGTTVWFALPLLPAK